MPDSSHQPFSQSLREELRDTGITVTALIPGATETKLFHRAEADGNRLGAREKGDPVEVALQTSIKE